ncbi:MAG: molecular chaperone HtpG [Pirellulales bacterium]|nr:molecular chaperone HtpG [Pirellulales bacterium]
MTDRQEFTFQAEVKQLLHLLAHSLYQSREIAVRELISNASDALDKMRHLSLIDERCRDDKPLEIVVERDAEHRQLILCDNGIGMTRDELIANLGTIAHSGSIDFLQKLAAAAKADLSLIGQFGVGFYSAFMIADRVRVLTRSYSETSGWEWESEGTGSFSIQPAAGLERGTRVVLHLKDDAKDFTEEARIKAVVQRYSGFIPHPIKMDGQAVNQQKAIWVEPASRLAEDDYHRFYQHITHQEQEKPLWYLHLSIDSPIQFHALLYCPATNLELLGFGRVEMGMNLCVRRVLIQHDCRELVPEYLRFLRGVVDSEDLPLNISRESLQDNRIFQKIRATIVRQVLDRLEEMAEKEPEKYIQFYRQFGRMLKEGVHLDFLHRRRLGGLLRFLSTHSEDPDHPASLAEYVQRAGETQRQIYYLTGPDLASMRSNPNLEIFRRRGVEVFYLVDPVDEFVMRALANFEDRPLVAIDSAAVELPPAAETKEAAEDEKAEEADEAPAGFDRVLGLFRSALGDKVETVRRSTRLVDSPCCLVRSEGSLSPHLQALMRGVDRDFVATRPVVEVNPQSPLIEQLGRLGAEQDEFIKDCCSQLFANAMLLEGVLPDIQEMTARIQRFIERAAGQTAP